MLKNLTTAAVVAAALSITSQANAAVFSFDLSGSRNAQFTLDTADATASYFQANFANVTGPSLFTGTTASPMFTPGTY